MTDSDDHRTLQCIVSGGLTTVKVTAHVNDEVDDLKELLSTEINRTSSEDHVDALHLVVWKLLTPTPLGEAQDLVQRMAQHSWCDFSEIAVQLDSLDDVLDVFPEQVSMELLYIFIEITDSTSQHRPMSPSKKKLSVDEFLDKCRPRMEELLNDAGNISSVIPSWESNYSADKKLVEHISRLRIPRGANGRPSLLLHNIGEERNNPEIAQIFSPDTHMLLVNTFGSGKTRLVLEGLCHNWGFYFVVKPDAAGVGSADNYQIIEKIDRIRRYYSQEEGTKKETFNNPVVIGHMENTVARGFARVFLARLLFLKFLIRTAQETSGGLQPREHRRLWMLLQAQPQNVSPNFDVDIFADLSQLFRHDSIDDLDDNIVREFQQLRSMLGAEAPIFCVLDQVELTLTLRHSFLNPLWFLWTSVVPQMRLVFSGTGMDLESFQNPVESAAFGSDQYGIKNDIGAFEEPGSQAEYIKQYVPACWTDPQWNAFLTRAWNWFRGSYRSTATLVSLILEGGFTCPHQTIDKYVDACTSFKPTDGEEWVCKESPPFFNIQETVTRLDFDKTQIQPSKVSNFLYKGILNGQYSLGGFFVDTDQQSAALVRIGLARHKPGKETVVDEPLAILAALQWVNTSVHQLMNTSRNDLRCTGGLTTYLFFYLPQIFKTPTKLDTVFTFRSDFTSGNFPWQHENFELVTLSTGGDGNRRVSVVTPTSGPSSNIGFQASSGEDVLEWISTNRRQVAFCFPPSSMGPDILLFGRSKASGKLILLVITCKSGNVIKTDCLVTGVRNVSPTWFWKDKSKKHRTALDAPFLHKVNKEDFQRLSKMTKDALVDIPNTLNVGGADYPILRIFASWEGDAGLERTLGRTEDGVRDPDPHPLATLHLENFTTSSKNIASAWYRGEYQ